MTQTVLCSIEDGVATITLNRPESLNALTLDMLARVGDLVRELEDDPAVGAVVLTGAGRAFCAGGDVKSMAAGSESAAGADERARTLRNRMEVSRLIHEATKPYVAMVRGPAAGAGLSLALACDLRVSGESARYITAFARVALSGDFGGSYFLTKLVGPARAKELYFTSTPLSAADALALGVTNRVVPDDALEAETYDLARRLARGPRIALRYMKKNLAVAERGSLADVLDFEALHHARAGQTEDHREAAQAFVEKREPAFKGR